MIPVFKERSEMMFQAVFLWVFFADGFRLKRKQAFAVVCIGQFQLFCPLWGLSFSGRFLSCKKGCFPDFSSRHFSMPFFYVSVRKPCVFF